MLAPIFLSFVGGPQPANTIIETSKSCLLIVRTMRNLGKMKIPKTYLLAAKPFPDVCALLLDIGLSVSMNARTL